MAAYEWVQMNGGEAAGHVLVLAEVGDGKITLYASVTEPVDRYLFIWGGDHPAVPILLSGMAAARLSGLVAAAVSNGMTPEEAEEWAWQKIGSGEALE